MAFWGPLMKLLRSSIAVGLMLFCAVGTRAGSQLEYSDPMRLQSPPESINKPELKCSVCVVACDAVQHQLQQVKSWTESAIMDSFEKAATLLGEQYGYSDAQVLSACLEHASH